MQKGRQAAEEFLKAFNKNHDENKPSFLEKLFGYTVSLNTMNLRRATDMTSTDTKEIEYEEVQV